MVFCYFTFPFFWLTAGITLALFGGVRKHSMDQNKVPVRGDIHVIVVGMLIFFFCIRLETTLSDQHFYFTAGAI